MKKHAVTWLVVAIVACPFSACTAPRPQSPEDRVNALFDPWDRSDSPGCAVGISRNGTILYEHGYGMASLELRVPITPDTVFGVASISKSFTAMSAVLAAERGFLSLDDDVQKYVPEWADRDDHITIRHLLTHTSGLRDAFTLLGWAPPVESAGDMNEAILKILSRQRGLNFRPGTEYQYDNGAYNLLASIIKRATGQSLRAFADATIFKPLGMTHSYFQSDPARASAYSRNASGWRVDGEDPAGVGNSGMFSTVGDLLRWEQNFDNVRVGTPAMLAAMQKPTILEGGKTSSYGLGLSNGEYRGVPTVEHSGGDHGVATKVVRFPNQHFAVAVLCNEDSVIVGGMARVNPDIFTNGIADIYLADELKPAPATATPASSPTPVKLSESELVEMAGLYRVVGRDLPVRITINHGTLMMRSLYQDDTDFELTPVGTNRFLLQNIVPVEFVPATADRPKEWLYGAGTDQRVLQPITQTVSLQAARSYSGTYRSEEIGVTYSLEARDSTLLVKSTGYADVPTALFSKDVFVGDFVGIVKFSRDQGGAVTGFTINRDAARGVRFDRVK
jgi:CubicO group peptidase (beta-lactamase class C family)